MTQNYGLGMTVSDRVNWLIATCGGCGYSPILPGTAGALWGIAVYVPIGLLTPEPAQTILIALALVAASVATFRLSPWAETFFAEKDSKKFVTDEVVGFLLTVLLFRTSMWQSQGGVWLTVAWAFPVTRIIDMIKIPPARRLEHLPAGWGVLADDMLGSVYAAGVLHLLAYLQPAWFGI